MTTTATRESCRKIWDATFHARPLAIFALIVSPPVLTRLQGLWA